MKHYLLEINGGSEIFIYLFATIIGWIIFYYTVKAAVKNGILEAKPNTSFPASNAVTSKPERAPNSEQKKLEMRYKNGEITLRNSGQNGANMTFS